MLFFCWYELWRWLWRQCNDKKVYNFPILLKERREWLLYYEISSRKTKLSTTALYWDPLQEAYFITFSVRQTLMIIWYHNGVWWAPGSRTLYKVSKNHFFINILFTYMFISLFLPSLKNVSLAFSFFCNFRVQFLFFKQKWCWFCSVCTEIELPYLNGCLSIYTASPI